MTLKYRAIGSVFLLTGCASTSPVMTTNNMAENWSERLRGYQMFAVFPPREDIQVGDLYAVCSRKNLAGPAASFLQKDSETTKNKKMPISVQLARLEGFSDRLETHYRTSIKLPAAAVTPLQGSSSRTPSSGSLPSNHSLFDVATSEGRLRNVSLPEFFSATLSQSQVGAMFPAGVVVGAAGVSSSDIASVSISIPSAASYGLPTWPSMDTACKSATWLDPQFWTWAKQAQRNLQNQDCAPDEEAKFLLVNEIYAAYAINVDFEFDRGTASRLQAAMTLPVDSTRKTTLDALLRYFSATANANNAKKADEPASPSKASTASAQETSGWDNGSIIRVSSLSRNGFSVVADTEDGTPPEQFPPATTGTSSSKEALNAALAAKLLALLDSATASTQQPFPGMTAQFVRGSSSGIKVERTFSNPVVVGYRGLFVEAPSQGTECDGGPIVGDGPKPFNRKVPLNKLPLQ